MGLLDHRFILLDYNQPNSLNAGNIYYDSTTTIKDKIDSLQSADLRKATKSSTITASSTVTITASELFPNQTVDLTLCSINLYVLDNDSSSPTYNKYVVDNSIITIAVTSSEITLINNDSADYSYKLIVIN